MRHRCRPAGMIVVIGFGDRGNAMAAMMAIKA